MTSEDSPAGHPWSWRALVLPFLFVFVTHGIIVRQAPLSTPFVKYNIAARTYLAGQMPLETLIDYSAVYLQLVVFIERLFYGSDRSFEFLTWLQVALVAASASLLFVALRRRFTLPLAALGVVAFAAQGHLMTAEQIFEPEVCLLFFLLGCIAAAGEKSPRAAGVAGIFASLALATRPTFVFIFLLAPAYYWVQGYRGRPLTQRSLLFLAPILIAFFALSLQAQRATGYWNAPRMSPGPVFYFGKQSNLVRIERRLSAGSRRLTRDERSASRSRACHVPQHRYRGRAQGPLLGGGQ